MQRLQQRVQRLQTQQPRSARAQRAQQRLLRAAERRLERLQGQQQVAPPAAAAAQPNAISRQDVARGRFAPRFAANGAPLRQLARTNGWSARQAWRRGVRASFVPWVGGVFWPYAYADIFDYTFWPAAYDDAYWGYAYDDFFDAAFWPSGSPYSDYAYGPNEVRGGRPASSRLTTRAVEQLCGDPDRGITAWPLAEVDRAVQPTAEQRVLLGELKAAAQRAAAAFRETCGGSFPLTPPGRLAAMASRIDATLEAVRTVRPALERFYDSLSDEQKARFNALGPATGDRAPQPETETEAVAGCGEPKPGLTDLPMERIQAMVRPTAEQEAALGRLRSATEQALTRLQADCPTEVAMTPPGRLEAMQKHLEAMSEAGKTVQPALQEFYASLSNEQKARFNSLSAQAGR